MPGSCIAPLLLSMQSCVHKSRNRDFSSSNCKIVTSISTLFTFKPVFLPKTPIFETTSHSLITHTPLRAKQHSEYFKHPPPIPLPTSVSLALPKQAEYYLPPNPKKELHHAFLTNLNRLDGADVKLHPPYHSSPHSWRKPLDQRYQRHNRCSRRRCRSRRKPLLLHELRHRLRSSELQRRLLRLIYSVGLSFFFQTLRRRFAPLSSKRKPTTNQQSPTAHPMAANTKNPTTPAATGAPSKRPPPPARAVSCSSNTQTPATGGSAMMSARSTASPTAAWASSFSRLTRLVSWAVATRRRRIVGVSIRIRRMASRICVASGRVLS